MALRNFQPPKQPARPVREAFKRPTEETSMLSLRIDAELHKKLKARAAMDGDSMTDILERLLRDYLDS